MTALPKRHLGPVAVTSLGLGTGALGGFGRAFSYDEFERVVLEAFDDGIRHFDTAPMYGYGKSEHYLGHVLRVHGLRDEVTLSTKAGRILRPAAPSAGTGAERIAWVDSLPFRDRFDYSYDGIMRSFEDSQQRLGLDVIDILFVHDLGRAWHQEAGDFHLGQMRSGGYRALDALRAGGAIAAVGLGVNETESVLTVSSEFKLDCALIAGRYSLLNHAPMHDAFPALQERGVGIVAAGIFNSGILAAGARNGTGNYDYARAPETIVRQVRRIEAVCEEFGVPLATAAIQFVHAHPSVTSVLIGAESVAEVRQNVAALDAAIPEAFWDALRTAELIPADAPTPSSSL
ncbi:aldo/keto reductase [Mesorhizobium sp. BR1-1-16]|uniref:aldo/keto reductase n=1 Tax=Mesorhizobium sp. BR1-1-16 TaxID=2876653 RepID=UPI001CCB1856|nr:aldo/keto reductase [Mesorhizobium sp. BR1-1-16]MBZ9937205.1 aldo/keto reductase [Mesorhizobium sp. BR1-1-16]